MDAPWRIEMLGWLRAVQGDQVVSRFRTQKTAALLAFLAFYSHRSHPRDTLLALLWPEDDLDVGRNKFRQALTSLRYQFEPPGVPRGAVLLTDRSTVQLNPTAVTTDVDQFETALRAAVQPDGSAERMLRLAEAVDLYRGELLPGHYEEWALQERQRLTEAYLQAAEQLVALLEQAGDLSRARHYARTVVSADPLREEAQHELIRLLAAAGEPAAALRQYQELERLLADQLGSEPADETRALIETIVRQSAAPVFDSQSGSKRLEEVDALGGLRHPSATDRHVEGVEVYPISMDLGAGIPGGAVADAGPAGTVTFLAVEVLDMTAWNPAGGAARQEQSQDRSPTPALESLSPDPACLVEVLRPVLRGHGGHELHSAGGTRVAVFARASDALASALAAQRDIARLQWSARDLPDLSAGSTGPAPSEGAAPAGEPDASTYLLLHPAYCVRGALYTAEVEPGEEARSSAGVTQALQLLVAAHPDQVLLSEKSAALVRDSLSPGLELVDLGRYRLTEQTRPERLFQAHDSRWDTRTAPSPRALPEYTGNLPLQFSHFFGREPEIGRLLTLMGARGSRRVDDGSTGDTSSGYPPPAIHSPAPRLVTLTGPGGTGKTRLALEAAARLQEPFRGAIWFVALADLSDSLLIADRILNALGLPHIPHQDPLDQAASFLDRQPSVMVLDNFEHLVTDGTRIVRALLDRVETLTLLVTSRQHLDLAGEHVFLVPPLPVPGEGPGSQVEGEVARRQSTFSPPLSTLLECPSVRLFVDRAQAVRPDFQLTRANAAAVAALCRHLEGIPLALELAAARAKVLTPPQMLARLERRFELLVSRQRDAAPRQQSLWATLDWSYRLLPAELQRFFARLSVFRGGFTLAAAEAVCGEESAQCAVRGARENYPAPGAPHRAPVLDYLEQLQEASLVLEEEAFAGSTAVNGLSAESITASTSADVAEIRFRMLETLREYGAEQLELHERPDLSQRHRAYYLALAERAEPELVGPDQSTWVDELKREQANLRTALGWMIESGEAEMGLRLVSALKQYWHLGDYWSEGAAWLGRLLPLPGAQQRTALRAKALGVAAHLNVHLGNLEAARALCDESTAIATALGDGRMLADSLNLRGEVDFWLNGPAAVQPIYEESLRIARELGDRWRVAATLGNLAGVRSWQGDYRQAMEHYEECLSLYRGLGDREGVATTYFGLGYMAQLTGRYEVARSHYQEGLSYHQALDHKRGIAWALNYLASLSLCQGEVAAARSYYKESLMVCRAAQNRWGIGWALLGLGDVARVEGALADAASFYEESLALFRDVGNRPSIASTLHGLGLVAARRGDLPSAAAMCGEALTVRHRLSDRNGIANSLEGLAGIAVARGALESAARLIGAAQAIREAIGAPLPPVEQPEQEQLLRTLQSSLGEAVFATSVAAGRTLLPEQASAEGLKAVHSWTEPHT